jgi:hypothetical protein
VGLHEIKNFCTTKKIVSKLKRLPAEWEKMFASYKSDKGLITREFKTLNSPQINQPIKKWETELKRIFCKEEIQMAKEHMKKCSPFFEMQIKATLRFHLIVTNVGDDFGKKEPSYTAGG